MVIILVLVFDLQYSLLLFCSLDHDNLFLYAHTFIRYSYNIWCVYLYNAESYMETEPIESVFFVSTNLCWIDFITILFLWKKSDSPKVFWFRRKMGKERVLLVCIMTPPKCRRSCCRHCCSSLAPHSLAGFSVARTDWETGSKGDFSFVRKTPESRQKIVICMNGGAGGRRGCIVTCVSADVVIIWLAMLELLLTMKCR